MDRRYTCRPIRPEDEPLEKDLFSRISRQTQYFRFFGYVKKVTHDMLVRYTQIDYDREIALIGLVKENDEDVMVGVVSDLFPTPMAKPRSLRSLSLTSGRDLGLGIRFMDEILEIAEEAQRIKKVYANVLKANTTMLHMFRKRGFEIKSVDEQSNYAEKLLEVEVETTAT